MGKFKRELTYTGDTSKLTNIQKKRVSSISREADTTTWLGDDVLGVEVIKYDVNGYSVNVKRGWFSFFSPFPCICKCIVNNFNPEKDTLVTSATLNTVEFYKNKNSELDIRLNLYLGAFIDPTNIEYNVKESLYIFNSGFHLIRGITDYSNRDYTFVFYPISITSYIKYMNNSPIFDGDGGMESPTFTFVQNHKSLIEFLGLKSTSYIRLVNLNAINYVALAGSNSLYAFTFIVERNNKELGKEASFKIIKTFDELTKVLDGSYGKGTMLVIPFSAKDAVLNNWETPTGKPALSYTTYTKDSPEIAKLTELYNSIK